MSQNEDDQHIEQIKSGDIQAFRFLVTKYKDMAFTLSLSILKNKVEAEDAAQESFIKAYQKLNSFRKDAKFSTWLYTIVYRTAVYNLRNIKRTAVFESEEMDSASDDLNQVEQMSLQEQQMQIRKAISTLPKTGAALITLYYLNEKSIAEIAQITGLSKSNIKVKLYRSRKQLERQLKNVLG